MSTANKRLGQMVAGVLVSVLLFVPDANAEAVSGDTLSACFPNDGGRVRIVESLADCNSTETGVSWNVQGPQGPPGPQGEVGPQGEIGPQGPPGLNGSQLVVVDGVGEVVGTVIEVRIGQDSVRVVSEIQGFLVVLEVVSAPDGNVFKLSGLNTLNPSTLVWESDDCTGTPHTANFPNPSLFDMGVIVPGFGLANKDIRRLYVRGGPQLVVTFHSVSFTTEDGSSCATTLFSAAANPLMLLDPDLATTFPPPYGVELQ